MNYLDQKLQRAMRGGDVGGMQEVASQAARFGSRDIMRQAERGLREYAKAQEKAQRELARAQREQERQARQQARDAERAARQQASDYKGDAVAFFTRGSGAGRKVIPITAPSGGVMKKWGDSGVLWDSNTGLPYAMDPKTMAMTPIDPEADGKTVVKDGHVYKVVEGLPWKWVGFDPSKVGNDPALAKELAAKTADAKREADMASDKAAATRKLIADNEKAIRALEKEQLQASSEDHKRLQGEIDQLNGKNKGLRERLELEQIDAHKKAAYRQQVESANDQRLADDLASRQKLAYQGDPKGGLGLQSALDRISKSQQSATTYNNDPVAALMGAITGRSIATAKSLAPDSLKIADSITNAWNANQKARTDAKIDAWGRNKSIEQTNALLAKMDATGTYKLTGTNAKGQPTGLLHDPDASPELKAKIQDFVNKTGITEIPRSWMTPEAQEARANANQFGLYDVKLPQNFVLSKGAITTTRDEQANLWGIPMPWTSKGKPVDVGTYQFDRNGVPFIELNKDNRLSPSQLSGSPLDGVKEYLPMSDEWASQFKPRKPSENSLSMLPPAQRREVMDNYKKELATWEQTAKDAWAGQKMDAERFNDTLTRWIVATPAQRQEMIAELDPRQKDTKASERRLDTRALFENGIISAQEGRLLERAFYGTDPVMPSVNEAWEDWQKNTAKGQEYTQKLSGIQKDTKLDLFGRTGLEFLGDMFKGGEAQRRATNLTADARQAFLSDYLEQNRTRVDFTDPAFSAARDKALKDVPFTEWVNKGFWDIADGGGSVIGIIQGTGALLGDGIYNKATDLFGSVVRPLANLAGETVSSKVNAWLPEGGRNILTDKEREIIGSQTMASVRNMSAAVADRVAPIRNLSFFTSPLGIAIQTLSGTYAADDALKQVWDGKTAGALNRAWDDYISDIDSGKLTKAKYKAHEEKISRLTGEFSQMRANASGWTSALGLEDGAGYRMSYENSMSDPRSAIAQFAAAYQQTRDPRLAAQARAASFSSQSELEIQRAAADYATMNGAINETTPFGGFKSAIRGGYVAPLTEQAIELGVNLLGIVSGGALYGVKAVGAATRVGSNLNKAAKAVTSFSRIGDNIADSWRTLGKIETTPGISLTRGQQIWNSSVDFGKQSLVSGGGEFFQEAVASFGEAGASFGDAINQGIHGAILGVGMGPVHAIGGGAVSLGYNATKQILNERAQTKALTQFVANYNKHNNTGTQLTVEVARQAQNYQSPQFVATLNTQRKDLMVQLADVNARLNALPADPQVRPGNIPFTPNPQRQQLLSEKSRIENSLQANLLDTAAVSEMSINTAREINALPPGQREVVDAAIRAANGVPLSVSQESTLLGHQTASGKPAAYTYGDDIVLTDEFREEIKQAAPETAKAPVLRKTQAERDAELRAKYGGVFRFINGRSVFIADKKPASATDPVQPAAPTAPVSSTTPAAPGFDAGNMAPPDQQPTTPVDPQIPQMPGAPADVIQPSASGPVQPATPSTPGVTPPAATPASPSPATPPTPEPTLESPDSTSATPQTPVGETPTPAPVAPSTPTNTTAPQVPAPISVTPPVTQNFQTPDGAQVTGTFEKQPDGTWQQTSPEAPSFTVTPENTQFFQALEDKAAYALNPQTPDAVQPGEFGQEGYTATTPAGSATDTTSESVTTTADPTADTTPPPLPEAETADVFTQPVNRGTSLLMLQTAAPWVSSAPLVVRSPRFFTRGNRVVDAKTYAELPKQERARYTPSPSPMFAHQGKIYIDETALVEYLGGVAPEARQEKLKAALREEVIHIATMNVRKRDQIIQDWQALPDAAKQRVVETYFTNELEAAGGDWTQVEVDEFQAGAEFWRMYLNAVNDGRTTEQVDMASEVADYAATNPTFAQRLKDTLQDIARWLREELLGQLDPDTRAEFEQTAAKIDAEVAKLDAMLGITPQPATPAAEAASPMEAPVEQANAPPVSAVEPAETIDTPAAPLTRLPEKAAPRNQAFIPKPARGAQKWTQEALNTALTSAAGSFGYKIVDTGIPSPYTAYGETLNYGTSLYDKLNPGNEIGQWIDAMNAGTNPAGNAIIQAASEPGLHRVWYGHDFFTNVDNVAAQFGWGEVPSYIIQLFKDSLTRSGLPLPGVELLVQSGAVSDRVATDWLSTNIGEVFGGGLSFLGTYKLYRAAKSGRLSKPKVIFATVGIGLKLVSGVMTAQPFLILSGLADTAILVTNLDQVKAAFKKGIQEFNKKPQAVRDLYERVAAPTAVAPVSNQQDGQEVKLPGSYPGDLGANPSPATTLPVQPVEGVEATPPPLPPEEVVTPEQDVVTDEATPPPLPVQPVEPAPAPTIKMAEAAKTLGVTPKELLRLVKAAVIPAERKGNNYLFTQEALDAYAAERAAKQAPVLEKLAAVAGNTATEADVADLRQRGLVEIYRGERVINQKGYDLMDKAGMAPRLTRNQRIEEIDSQLGPVEKDDGSDIALNPRVTKSGRLYLVRGPQGSLPAQIPITDDAVARTEANRIAAEFDAKEAELEARAAEMQQEPEPTPEDEGLPELSDEDAKLVPKFFNLFVSQMRDFREARERGESTPESLDRLVTQAVAVAKRLGMANLHPGTLLMNMSRLPEGPLMRSQADFIDAVHDVLQDGTRDIAPADLTLKAGITSPAGFTNRDSAPLSWAQMIQLGALKATPRPDGSLRVRMGKTPEQMKADAEKAELEAMQQEYLDDLRAETGNLDKAMEDASASGFELLDAIQMAGGLPSPTSASAESHRGELTTLFESAKAMGKGAYGGKGIFVSRIFRKDAPDLDRLAQSLRGHGFDTFTPSDVLDLVDARFTENRPMYGTTVDFDDGLSDRAVAAKPRVRLANASITTEPGPIFLKKAHHGTPHKVDRFSLEKIGTGEGAQAYGWGLYFAENQGVALDYQRTLAKRAGATDAWFLRPIDSATKKYREAINYADAAPMSISQTISALNASEADAPRIARELAAAARKPEYIKAYNDIADMIEAGEVVVSIPTGNLYTVELDVDDADLLDWDKPLSTQSEKVRAANKAMEPLTGQKEFFQGVGSLPGSWLYNALAKSIANSKNALETNDRTATKNEAKLASDALLAAGISGIRYLDAGSRKNNASIFKDGDKWAVTYNNPAAGMAVQTDRFPSETEARAFLNSLPESYNFVIFDENLIRIVAENGEPVGNAEVVKNLMADSAAAGMLQEDGIPGALPLDAAAGLAESGARPGAQPAQGAAPARAVDARQGELGIPAEDAFAGIAYRPARIWGLQALADRFLALRNSVGGQTIQPPIFRRDFGTREAAFREAAQAAESLYRETLANVDAVYADRPGRADSLLPRLPEVRALFTDANGEVQLLGSRPVELDAGEPLFAKPRRIAPHQLDLFTDNYNQTATPWTPSWQAKEPAKTESETTAPALSLEPQTEGVGRIEDFGEKLEGARKDLWQRYTDMVMAELPADARDITLAKYLPEPDYEAMIASGMEPARVAAVKALRDLIPRKPSTGYKLAVWTKMVRDLRPLIQRLIDPANPIPLDKFQLAIADSREIRDTVRFYEDLGWPHFTQAKGWKLKQSEGYIRWGGELLPKGTVVSYMEKDYRAITDLDSVNPPGDWRQGYAAVIQKFRDYLDAQAAQAKEPKKIDFQIYSDTQTRDVFIGKKGVSGVIRLQTGFASAKEARNWLADHYNELALKWEGMRQEPVLRRATNEPRTGPKRREGDVTPEMFSEAFGFRGVQFGNYVEGDRRQRDLNNAFDAFMDLSEALGIPAKALSFDGSLGLAFGARGRGGKRAAAAHYEPGEVVINLTKNAGPGSLAHEWFHALDNYFARLERTGSTKPKDLDEWATRNINDPRNVRPEVMEAFRAIRNSLGGDLDRRSRALDSTRSAPYYSQTIEKAARAFETYVIDRLGKSSVTNDYLANIDPTSEAYPRPNEMDGGIRQAFDTLFTTLDTRQGERGTMLFAKPRRQLAEGGFYLKSAEVIDSKIQGKQASLEQVKALLENPQNGIKAEELKWTGVVQEAERLAKENNGKVPKDALLRYLAEDGAVEMEEVRKGASNAAALEKRWEAAADAVNKAIRDRAPYKEQDRLRDIRDGIQKELDSARENTTESKYSKYQLPGGENYREVVLAMPPRDIFDPAKVEIIRNRSSATQGTAQIVYDGKKLGPAYSDLGSVDTDWQKPDSYWIDTARQLFNEGDKFNNVKQVSSDYTSSHFDTPNYVAHMRLNERTDTEGRPGLFIEELQSDRHQQGREKGYNEDLDVARREELRKKTGALTDAEMQELGELNSKALGRGIPDAPFRTTWPLQLFKRALRDAVAGGKDWIGWTTGETQAERFDLSKQLDAIQYDGDSIYVKRTGEAEFDAAPLAEGVQPADLEKYIGKEAAKKLMTLPEVEGFSEYTGPYTARTLEGENLKVGGEGMVGFYDNMVPKEVAKYVKQWGGKVEKAPLGDAIPSATRLGDDRYQPRINGRPIAFDLEYQTEEKAISVAQEAAGKKSTPVWRVDITPQMRESVEDGQPLFAKRRPMRDTTAELFGNETPFNLVGETLPPSAPARPDIVVDAQAREAAFRQSGREDVGDLFAEPAPPANINEASRNPEWLRNNREKFLAMYAQEAPYEEGVRLVDLGNNEYVIEQQLGKNWIRPYAPSSNIIELLQRGGMPETLRRGDLARMEYAEPAPAIPSPAMSGRRSEGAAAPSAISQITPSRTRPKERITFQSPISTPIGKIVAYEWQYKLEETPDRGGEMVLRRFSDWNAAEKNAQTGRDIVHQFTVEKPNGTSELVSLESALGQVPAANKETFKSVIRAARRLPVYEAELAALEKQQKEYNEAANFAFTQGWKDAPDIKIRDTGFPAVMERGARMAWIGNNEMAVVEPQNLNADKTQITDRTTIENIKRNWAIQQIGAQKLTETQENRIASLRRSIKKDKATLLEAQITQATPETTPSVPQPRVTNQTVGAPQDITGQAGTEFRPRNILKGIMSSEFVYRIENDTPVPSGNKLVASKIYERKIPGHHPLWRLSIIENANGERYVIAENASDQIGSTQEARSRFEKVSDDKLETRQLDPISKAALDFWKQYQFNPAPESKPIAEQGTLFAKPRRADWPAMLERANDISVQEFAALARDGKLNEATGEPNPMEAGTGTTPISLGAAAGYPLEDIAHFYIARQLPEKFRDRAEASRLVSQVIRSAKDAAESNTILRAFDRFAADAAAEAQAEAVLYAKPRRTPPPLPPMEKRIEASLDAIENWNNVLRAAEEKPAGSVRKLAGEIREAMPYEIWKGYQNLFRGRLDVADAIAPGVKNILQAAQQEEALAQIGVNAVVDGLRRELQKAFGDPAFWNKNRARLKEATRLLLPTASYLQPQRAGVDGGFEWREFERRSGTISQVEARKLRLRDGEWFQYDGRTYRLGDFLPDEKAFVLLEPISVEMQQAIYEEFWQNFPEALPILDRWITPDLKDAYTVGLGSTMSVEFNREALLSFMNEWPQDLKDAFGDLLPEVPRVEGYTPDIAAQRSIIATIARLLGIYKSPGRRFKTGALREAGNVKNLVDGFSTRAMEAHREKIRMRMREGIIEKAVVLRDDVPAENIGDYVALEDVFSSIVKAVEAARLLDKKAYPHLSKGLNPKDQVQLMKLVGDAARLNGIEQMVHKNVYRELMLSMARAQTEGILLRTLNFFLRGAKLGKLAAGSVGINWIGNQILTLTQAMNRMFAGITHLMVLDSRGAAVNTMEALFLLRGLITDRAPNTLNQSRIGDLIPRELFDNTTALSSLDAGTDYGNMVDDIKRNGILRGPAQGLVNAFKQGGISASILYAVHYSGGDAAVKQQSAYAAYRARAEVAANEAKVKSGRSEWMRNWIQKQVRENTAIHREVMDAARLYFMDYANVPAWMDPSASLPEEKGKKFLKEHGLWFIKWPYNFVRFMKRMGLDGAIETFSPSSTKQERARGLANMLTLAAIAYGGAALLSGDDEEDPIIGSRFDAEGKAKDRDQDTSSRMNLSALGRKTRLGRVLASALRMAGVNINDDLTNHRGDDYWMYYQNMTWMKEGLLMGRAVRGDLPGFLRDAGAYISDLTALGILSRMVGIAKVGSIDAKKSPVNLASEAFFEALSSPINPSALTEYISNTTDPVVRRTTSNKSLDFTMGPLESIMAKVPGLRKNIPVAGDPITPARLTLNFDRSSYMAREAKKIRENNKLTIAEKDAALANLSNQVATPVSSSGAPVDLRELLFGMGVDPAKVSDAGQTTRNIAGDLARLQAMGAGPESVRVFDEKLPSGETRTYITYPDPDNVAVRDPFLSLFKIATGVNIRPFPKPKSLRQPPSTLTPELMFNQPQANLTLPRQ